MRNEDPETRFANQWRSEHVKAAEYDRRVKIPGNIENVCVQLLWGSSPREKKQRKLV